MPPADRVAAAGPAARAALPPERPQEAEPGLLTVGGGGVGSRLVALRTRVPVRERSRVQGLGGAAPADPGQPPRREDVRRQRGGGRAVRSLVAYSTLSCQEQATRTGLEQAEMMSAGRVE